jgi:hypothetical protein
LSGIFVQPSVCGMLDSIPHADITRQYDVTRAHTRFVLPSILGAGVAVIAKATTRKQRRDSPSWTHSCRSLSMCALQNHHRSAPQRRSHRRPTTLSINPLGTFTVALDCLNSLLSTLRQRSQPDRHHHIRTLRRVLGQYWVS